MARRRGDAKRQISELSFRTIRIPERRGQWIAKHFHRLKEGYPVLVEVRRIDVQAIVGTNFAIPRERRLLARTFVRRVGIGNPIIAGIGGHTP